MVNQILPSQSRMEISLHSDDIDLAILLNKYAIRIDKCTCVVTYFRGRVDSHTSKNHFFRTDNIKHKAKT